MKNNKRNVTAGNDSFISLDLTNEVEDENRIFNENNEKELTPQKAKLSLLKTFFSKQKLIAIGIVALLTIGILGATTSVFETKEGSFLSNIAEKVGLKKPKSTLSYQPANPPTGPLQLSKEYVYAGSRTLSVEDYGVVPANPTPTP